MTSQHPDINYLFLDRDGVINRRLPGAYVADPGEFDLLPGVVGAIRDFNSWFDRVVVVTNQQGIGKGLMTEEDLHRVHRFFLQELRKRRAWVDGIYYCPHLSTKGCDCRKPKPGLAQKARHEFPEIDFRQSFMVGDSASDMIFGKNLGMRVVWISSRVDGTKPPFPPDLNFPDLASLADHWRHIRSTSVQP